MGGGFGDLHFDPGFLCFFSASRFFSGEHLSANILQNCLHRSAETTTDGYTSCTHSALKDSPFASQETLDFTWWQYTNDFCLKSLPGCTGIVQKKKRKIDKFFSPSPALQLGEILATMLKNSLTYQVYFTCNHPMFKFTSCCRAGLSSPDSPAPNDNLTHTKLS